VIDGVGVGVGRSAEGSGVGDENSEGDTDGV
jgi:hypothetical protein